MSIQIVPPDPRAIEAARRKKIWYAAMTAIFASAGSALYLFFMMLGCAGSGQFDVCMAHFNPYLAAALAAVAVFVLGIIVASEYYDG